MKRSLARGKLLLNMQMSPLDYHQGKELLRLICDLEDAKRDDVVVMLTHRYDMVPDPALRDMVLTKFEHVITHKTERVAKGWPAGPNAMFGDSYHAAVMLHRKGLHIDAVMFMECDCVPLAKDWINQLKNEWHDCRQKGKYVLGSWLEKGDAGCKHINGNCIMAIDYWKKNRGITNAPAKVGWDAYHAGNMCGHGMASRLIFSDYRLGTPDNPWRNDEYLWEPKGYGTPSNPLYGEKINCAWLHGVKCMDGIKAVRKKLLTSRLNDTCSQ